MCVNYGSRVEITDAINAITEDVASGKLKPGSVTDKTLSRYLNSNYLPDVDLFLRSSGEQRTSNFLLWQSAYAEFVFMDTLWPDFNRESLWSAIGEYVSRDRRFGGAIDKPKAKKSK
jgi:undecaprenyl diphosphate synthase